MNAPNAGRAHRHDVLNGFPSLGSRRAHKGSREERFKMNAPNAGRARHASSLMTALTLMSFVTRPASPIRCP